MNECGGPGGILVEWCRFFFFSVAVHLYICIVFSVKFAVWGLPVKKKPVLYDLSGFRD